MREKIKSRDEEKISAACTSRITLYSQDTSRVSLSIFSRIDDRIDRAVADEVPCPASPSTSVGVHAPRYATRTPFDKVHCFAIPGI